MLQTKLSLDPSSTRATTHVAGSTHLSCFDIVEEMGQYGRGFGVWAQELKRARPPTAGRSGEPGRDNEAGSIGPGAKRGGGQGAVAGCGRGSSIYVSRGGCRIEGRSCLSF